ncbi:MAG: polysaccharide biosynthesis/export family protein [Pseudomonadota bacterium]
MLTAALGVAGCANTLPQVGPTSGDLLDPNPEQTVDYAIVSLDASAVEATRAATPLAFEGEGGFRNARPLRTSVIGVGDVLDIAIWEPVEDGLLTAAGAKQAAVNAVVVDDRGHIYVPYAGSVHASGKTPERVRAEIVARLSDQTTDPQVTVTRSAYNSRGVSFQGAVRNPGVQPLEPLTARLLPMLSKVGGATSKPGSTKVTIRRSNLTSSAFLDDVYEDPSANIALRSGDIVLLEAESRHFNAFGSVAQPGRQPLAGGDMSLLDAITEVGGLDGNSANATGVFVFRREPADVVSQLNPVAGREAHGMEKPELTRLGPDQPVIYQLALNTADAMFVASSFAMRDGDTIYVTEAPYTQFRKVLSVIVPTLGTAGSIASLRNVAGN